MVIIIIIVLIVGTNTKEHGIPLFHASTIHLILIKTHDSKSRGQEKAGHMRQMSELFTGSTAVKVVNALKISRRLSYCLVIKDSAHSNHIELATQQWRIGTTNPENQPLRVLWRSFMRPCLQNYPLDTNSPVY